MKIYFRLTIDDKLAALCRKIFTVKTIVFLVAVCLFTMGLFLFSDQITKPHTFVSDTVISSAEMNENFDALYTLINQHDTSIKILQQGGGIVDDVEFYMVPKGAIIMWSGEIAAIPSGWALCDGTQDTPDLKGRFIVGYNSEDGDYNAISNTGGEKRHTLSIAEMPRHSHTFRIYDFDWDHRVARSGASDRNSPGSEETGSTGGGEAHENRPPYYVMAYIMKL